MSAVVDLDEARLERDLEGTADWLAIRQAAINALSQKLAALHAEATCAWTPEDSREIWAEVDSTKRALARACAWQPMLELPRRK